MAAKCYFNKMAEGINYDPDTYQSFAKRFGSKLQNRSKDMRKIILKTKWGPSAIFVHILLSTKLRSVSDFFSR